MTTMFDLKRPCSDCPFRVGMGERFALAPERLEGIRRAAAFVCHKTVDYDADPVPQKLVENFHARYVVDPGTGCWNWTAALDHYGYGAIGIGPRRGGRLYKAHRLSWEINTGLNLPSEVHVCHSCDNRKCVNPDHLFIGDNTINQLDAVAKGRRKNYRPVSIADVQAMRDEYVADSKTHGTPALAKKYGCSTSQAHYIVTMQTRVNYRNNRPQQCAGLMAVLRREGADNQIMQVAERLAGVNHDDLDPDKEAYGSWSEVCQAHRRGYGR